MTNKADYVLPVGTFTESEGTVINNEGRAQRYFKCFQPREEVLESWRYITETAIAAGNEAFTSLKSFDDVMKALVQEMPQFKGILDTAPPSDFRKAGQKIPREPHRYSGRTAMNADKNVSEPKPPDDDDSPLSFTMEGFRGEPPSSLIPFYWAPGWNSVQSINKYQIEVGGPLHDGDPGVRLIEANQDTETQLNFYKDVPEKFEPKENERLLVPLYHIYGSEELSSRSPAIKERIPEAYIAITRKDSEKLEVNEKEHVEITVSGKKLELPVKILKELPDGTAGYPVNLPGIKFTDLPSFHNIEKAVK
jgi:NADH-quinone oxidoreductase subunit G